MTTLDDKLLGEKLQYYYSSSEDEDSDKEERDEDHNSHSNTVPTEVELSSDGSAVNTGACPISHSSLLYVKFAHQNQ